MEKASVAKNWFRCLVPSHRSHAATSYHIKKYFDSQVTLFLIIALGEWDVPEPKQRDRLHSLDIGLDYTGECLKKIYSAFDFCSSTYRNLFMVKGTQHYIEAGELVSQQF